MTVPTDAQIENVRGAIERVLDGDPHGTGACYDVLRLISAYYNPDPCSYGRTENVLFAGRWFDELPGNDPRAFTSGDLAAAALLDVRFGPHTVRGLLYDWEPNVVLASIPTNLPLWEVSEHDLMDGSPALKLWGLLRGVHDIGPTRASKLTARKRPHLFPILDSIVKDTLELPKQTGWLTLRAVLQSVELRARIDALAPAATEHGAATPSTLRLLDVAVWMSASQSEQARAVRGAV